MGVSEDDDSDHTSDCTGWAAQRISTAFMTALVGVIHDQARHQQTSLTLPFRTTVHTVADLYCISWESQLGIGHQARTGFEAVEKLKRCFLGWCSIAYSNRGASRLERSSCHPGDGIHPAIHHLVLPVTSAFTRDL